MAANYAEISRVSILDGVWEGLRFVIVALSGLFSLFSFQQIALVYFSSFFFSQYYYEISFVKNRQSNIQYIF